VEYRQLGDGAGFIPYPSWFNHQNRWFGVSLLLQSKGGHLLFVDILQQNRRLQHASLWTSLHFAEGPIHEAA
jgi:hypothetical protein